MRKAVGVLLALAVLAVLGAGAWLYLPYHEATDLPEDTPFVVSDGATLTSIARDLESDGVIADADGMLLRAKLLGGDAPIRAGEFLLPAGASFARIVDTLQSGDVVRRFVTVPEGMPSILVYEKLMAEPLLTGTIAVPEEGSVLPETYDFERGETRQAVLDRMQAAMDETLAELWAERSSDIAVKTPEEAITLASIVEKETGKASERPMVAGVLSNRVRIGMMLGADATTIYPITKGKPLGRRIRVSELRDRNPYNTRAIAGLPAGPITNPGRASIAAVLDPAETDALYYVADGSGGHVFARTLQEHNENVRKWREFRAREGI